jgi:hypothetical protein
MRHTIIAKRWGITMRSNLLLASVAVLACASGAAWAGNTVTRVPVTWETPTKQNLYSGLFATYSANATSVSFTVCGSLPESEGCYGFATMQPFEQACAVLEGKPKINKDNVMTRAIYVLDKRTSKAAPITLYVYKRTDTLTDSDDTVQVTLEQSVPLGLTGGSSSHCSMAGNDDYVYAATDQDETAAGINKKTLTVSQLGGFSPPSTITSITADDRGYVSLHFVEGFYVFAPDGSGEEDGGGAADMVNTRNGWIPQ